MGAGEWIGLGLAIVIAIALVVVTVVAVRATTVRWHALPNYPGCKYAWKGKVGDVSHLVEAIRLAEACIRKHLKVPTAIIDATFSKALVVVWPEPKLPNPNYPRIIGAPPLVWGVCWGQEIWVGSGLEALCHELCHDVLQGYGVPVTDHSRFEDLGANAAISEYELASASLTP